MSLAFKLPYLILLSPFILLNIWSSAAIWFDSNYADKLYVVIGFSAVWVLSLFFLRASLSKLIVHGILSLGVFLWWSTIPAQNDRDWSSEYAELPRVEFQGNTFTVHNLRNFNYSSETDAEERWESRTYNLDSLTGVDMFFSYWGSPHIAHTVTSWQFSDMPPLAISIETRREKSEDYSAILGFFKQYELYYVVADEQDLIKVRTNHRAEDVFLYRLATPVPFAKKILKDYLERINELAEAPAWYNAGTHNCTTSIRHHVASVAEVRPWSWQILLNGHLPARAHQEGVLGSGMSFQEFQAASLISSKGKLAGERNDFSDFIRETLPKRSVY